MMKKTRLYRYVLYVSIQAPILFLANLFVNPHTLKQNIIVSIYLSFFSAILFRPVSKLVLSIERKYFQNSSANH